MSRFSAAAHAKINQSTKLGIVASTETPHESELAIKPTVDFKRIPVEVLKLTGGGETVIQVVADFDNGDAGDFVFDEMVEFDGTMKLKTINEDITVHSSQIIGTGTMETYLLDVSELYNIESVGEEV